MPKRVEEARKQRGRKVVKENTYEGIWENNKMVEGVMINPIKKLLYLGPFK